MSAATLAALRAGQLKGAKRLDLSCGLHEFPPEIFDLADTLEILNLSGNALRRLPEDLHRLRHLRILFGSNNAFTELPPSLGQCPQLEMVGFKANHITEVAPTALPPRLRWLILTDNAISALPDAVGECARLEKLMLAGNRLRDLPATLAQCKQLALVRLAANDFDTLPDWLLSMPKLAWLAVAGNPMTLAQEARAIATTEVPDIPWAQLHLGEQLGEGASGYIHAARWTPDPATTRAVAVKLFKAGVTSDGWPTSELAAGLLAGPHERLVGVLGRLVQHPDGHAGLVMPQLGPEWHNLAAPPSFESCTRDVYDPSMRLHGASAQQIACDVATAMAHLHTRGLVHGDLYAHNVLWREGPEGTPSRALLSDLDAAAQPPDRWQAALRVLDLRAFGHLADELLMHSTSPAPALASARDACLAATPSSLPAFSTLAAQLRVV